MQYTVTDKGHYEEITLPEWGEVNGLDAAFVFYGDTFAAAILEPAGRGRRGEYVGNDAVWSEDDERKFRSDVEAVVDGFEEQPDAIIFDPGRDRQSSIER